MRAELLYNPLLLIERIGEIISEKKRFKKLKNTPAVNLNNAQLDSLEFLELIKNDGNNSIFFDIGANAGTWSLLVKSLFPKAVIHAFEPVPNYQLEFKKSTEKLSDITLHPFAAGNANKFETYNLSGHSSSFLEVTEELLKIHPNEKKTGEINVKMIRLDDFVKQHHIPYPNVLKLDVEGFELEALKGAEECMKNASYIILEVSFIERHRSQPLFNDIVKFMADNNYLVCAFPVTITKGKPITSTDILFKNKNK